MTKQLVFAVELLTAASTRNECHRDVEDGAMASMAMASMAMASMAMAMAMAMVVLVACLW